MGESHDRSVDGGVPAEGPLPDRKPPDRSTAPQSAATTRQIAMGAVIAAVLALVIVGLAVVI